MDQQPLPPIGESLAAPSAYVSYETPKLTGPVLGNRAKPPFGSVFQPPKSPTTGLRLDPSLGEALSFSKTGEEIKGRLPLNLQPERIKVNMAIMAVSNHIGSRYPFNETNPGIGFDFRLSEKFGVAIGSYENSFNNGSSYVMGYVDQPMIKAFNRLNISAGAMMGAVSGYKKGIAPLFNWSVAVQDDTTGFGARLLIIPSSEGIKHPAKLFKPKVVALQLLQNAYQTGDWTISFSMNVNKRVPEQGLFQGVK